MESKGFGYGAVKLDQAFISAGSHTCPVKIVKCYTVGELRFLNVISRDLLVLVDYGHSTQVYLKMRTRASLPNTVTHLPLHSKGPGV
jgi:hypothetical protein